MYIKKKWIHSAGVGIISFGAGVVTGYFLRKLHKEVKEVNTFRKDVDEVMQDQFQLKLDWQEQQRVTNKNLQETNKILKRFREVNEEILGGQGNPTPLFVSNSDEFDQSKKNHPSKKDQWEHIAQVVEEPMIVVSVDEHGREIDPNWSYEEELRHRSPDRPYIIHRDEFFSNEMDFEQTSLMYFRKDNVLCDEADVPIPNYEKVVGRIEFGHGSLDQSICYIRCERIEHEWEIILDEGSFASEVLGVEMENEMSAKDLKHSVPKFRRE